MVLSLQSDYSATLDVSKYFHMFLTKTEERKHMGSIHPITGETYMYRTLPIGTGNSHSTKLTSSGSSVIKSAGFNLVLESLCFHVPKR